MWIKIPKQSIFHFHILLNLSCSNNLFYFIHRFNLLLLPIPPDSLNRRTTFCWNSAMTSWKDSRRLTNRVQCHRRWHIVSIRPSIYRIVRLLCQPRVYWCRHLHLVRIAIWHRMLSTERKWHRVCSLLLILVSLRDSAICWSMKMENFNSICTWHMHIYMVNRLILTVFVVIRLFVVLLP